MAKIGEILTVLKHLFPLWAAAPRPIKWLLALWGFTTMLLVGWIVVTFKLQPLIQLWLAAPSYLKPLLVLWVVIACPVASWWLVWLSKQQTRPITVRAQRVLDDFSEYLDKQVPLHKREMEQIAQEIIAATPASITGWSGNFYARQIAAAKRRQREIRNRWKATCREIQDSFMQVGAREENDPLIGPRLKRFADQVQQGQDGIREVCREFCLRGDQSYNFEGAWSSVQDLAEAR